MPDPTAARAPRQLVHRLVATAFITASCAATAVMFDQVVAIGAVVMLGVLLALNDATIVAGDALAAGQQRYIAALEDVGAAKDELIDAQRACIADLRVGNGVRDREIDAQRDLLDHFRKVIDAR